MQSIWAYSWVDICVAEVLKLWCWTILNQETSFWVWSVGLTELIWICGEIWFISCFKFRDSSRVIGIESRKLLFKMICDWSRLKFANIWFKFMEAMSWIGCLKQEILNIGSFWEERMGKYFFFWKPQTNINPLKFNSMKKGACLVPKEVAPSDPYI